MHTAHTHTLQDCTDGGAGLLRERCAQMEEGIRNLDGATTCPHCRLRVLDCLDTAYPHHDGYELDWDCRYQGVITTLVAKAFTLEGDNTTLEMLRQWMGKDGRTLLEKPGWAAWPGEENKRVIHEWLEQRIDWFGVKVPRILQVFFRLAEDAQVRYKEMQNKGWILYNNPYYN